MSRQAIGICFAACVFSFVYACFGELGLWIGFRGEHSSKALSDAWAGTTAAIAHHSTLIALRALATRAHLEIHLGMCRLATASVVFSAALCLEDVWVALGLCVVILQFPDALLCFGRKQKQVEVGATSSARATTGPPHAIATAGGLPGSPCNRRYDVDFWGKAWGLGRAGRPGTVRKASACDDANEQPQADLDGQVNLSMCRDLLVKLPLGDLEDRLRNSPWGKSKHPTASDNWLREAADAFTININSKDVGSVSWTLKTKETVVQEVVQAVQRLRSVQEGGESSAPMDVAVGGVAQVGHCV